MTILKGKVGGQWVPLSGAGQQGQPGVGVPAGGATNSILTKTSAADYATAWNTSITVQNLTAMGDVGIFGSQSINGPITINSNDLNLAKNFYIRWSGTTGITIDTDNALWLGQGAATVEIPKPTRVSGDLTITGTPYWTRGVWITSSVGGIQAIAVGAGADNTVYLGGNAPTTVSGNLTVIGTFISKHAVRATGTVNGGDGSVANGFGFAGGSRLAPGSYRLTLVSALTNIYPSITPTHPSAAVMATFSIVSGTVFDVKTYFHDGTITDCWFGVQVAGY